MSESKNHSWTDVFDIGSRQASALREEFDSLDSLLESFREAEDLTEIDGVGTRTARSVTEYIQSEHPDLVDERHEKDQGICTEFTVDHGLVEDELAGDAFYWAFICPRCETTNPLKGDPNGFKNRPFKCESCRWVSLLHGADVDAFRAEHYEDGETA